LASTSPRHHLVADARPDGGYGRQYDLQACIGSGDMTGSSVAAAIAAAGTGPVLTGEIFPLSGVGKIRVTYNWLYSALNCDPNDQSGFGWVFQKMSDSAIALSPQAPYAGMSLFASVRPDNSYYVQVQAPGSADWITQAQGDEEITMTDLGLLTVELQGLNGSYLAANGAPTSFDGHSGYLVQSNVGTPDQSSQFFVAVSQNLQRGVGAPLFATLSEADVRSELERHGVQDPGPFTDMIRGAAGL